MRITCIGEAFNLELRPEPAIVDLRAILPNAENPNEAFFSLWNDSEVPIEVRRPPRSCRFVLLIRSVDDSFR